MKKLYNSLFVVTLASSLIVTSIYYDNNKDISESEIIVISNVEESELVVEEPELIVEESITDIVTTNYIDDYPFEEVDVMINEQSVEDPIVEEIAQTYILTEEEIDLVALITMAEVEGESELAKRLVIDTILNRVDDEYFPDTVHGVIYAPSQFSCVWNGRVDRCYVMEDIRALVEEELLCRTNSEVLYFRADYYFDWGTPVISDGRCYFSK